jgi:hypothetical protein
MERITQPRPTCAATTSKGTRCQSPALLDGEYCFTHDPRTQRERQEARRLGGLRRRREKTVSTVYDWEGLDSVAEIRRILLVAVSDLLGLENSVARCRTLGTLMQVALKALEVGELEERVEALEEAVKQQTEERNTFGRG